MSRIAESDPIVVCATGPVVISTPWISGSIPPGLTVTATADGVVTFTATDGPVEPEVRPVVRETLAGRNDPCPCGSGMKYKRCCRAVEAT